MEYLRRKGTCIKFKEEVILDVERINENAMIVIGTCFNFYSQYFQSSLSDAPPFLSTQKSNSSRCTHPYLLTSCSAQALVHQIHLQKNDFLPSDDMQNDLFRLSGRLQ